MTKRDTYLAATVAVLAAFVTGWLLFVLLARLGSGGSGPEGAMTSGTQSGEAAGRRIQATLFYIAPGGTHLVGIEREVPFEAGTAEQARRLLEEQLTAAPPPLVNAVPAGTTVRALFVTERGDAFVDLSREVSSNHHGGSLDELLTVYTLVNVLTANLPAVTAVQILIEGREVDTLAGHVDLRNPLQQNLAWVEDPRASVEGADN